MNLVSFNSNILFIPLTANTFLFISGCKHSEHVPPIMACWEKEGEGVREGENEEGERKEEKEKFLLFFFLMEMMMMMISTMMMGMTVGMMTMMMQRCWSSDAWIGTIIHYIYLFDISHSLFMEVCPYFDIYCAHCIAVHSRIWMFLLSKRLRWLPPSHPHELYDCSNGFTFIPYTSLTHVPRFTEESIPVVEIQPLLFFKISS